MIEVFGWCCTALVLYGFLINSQGKHQQALVAWIVGDVGWIVYDIYIDNFSHLFLSAAIIFINLYGIYNKLRRKNESHNLDQGQRS